MVDFCLDDEAMGKKCKLEWFDKVCSTPPISYILIFGRSHRDGSGLNLRSEVGSVANNVKIIPLFSTIFPIVSSASLLDRARRCVT